MITEELLLELHEFINKKNNEIQSFNENIILEMPVQIDTSNYSKNKNLSEQMIHKKSTGTIESKIHKEIKKYIESQSEETFTQVLFNFIDMKDSKDSAVYKKAGIDRKHFSKIRSNPNYKPVKIQ